MQSDLNLANSFLAAFRKIETHLRADSNDKFHMPFSELISSSHHHIVKRFYKELNQFARLRNAIVHTDSGAGDSFIAYPASNVVEKIKLIADAITSPPLVTERLKKNVRTLPANASLKECLQVLAKFHISQVPIVEGNKVIEILNGNSIAMWLATQDTIDLDETKINEVLPSIERKNNFKFCRRKTDVYEAADMYENTLHKGFYMDAILITENGKNGEALLGIIVLEDIASFLTDQV